MRYFNSNLARELGRLDGLFRRIAPGLEVLSGRIVPTRKTVVEGSDFLDPDAPPRSARIFLDSIANIRRTPSIAAWNEIETRADPLVEEWFFGAEPSRKSLDQELGEATRELFEEPLR